MKTLLIICIIWYIKSLYNLNKIRIKEGKTFINPFDGTFLDYMGFIIGFFATIITTFFICVKYLP